MRIQYPVNEIPSHGDRAVEYIAVINTTYTLWYKRRLILITRGTLGQDPMSRDTLTIQCAETMPLNHRADAC
jgi:hypothetical protein